MVIEDLIQLEIVVQKIQTTFIELRCGSETIRVDLEDKKEFKLKSGSCGSVVLLDTHPLLVNYTNVWMSGFINSRPPDPMQFIEDVKRAIQSVLEGWRSWTEYVTDSGINFTLDTLSQNVEKGSGKLFEAPQIIAYQIESVCQRHQVAIKTFPYSAESGNYRLLFLGQGYVIAKSFSVKQIG